MSPHVLHCCCFINAHCCALCVQPENFAAKDVLLPAPVRAAPPRDLGKFDIIGQIPPNKQLPVIRRLLTPVSGLMSPESQLAGV